MKNLVLVLSLVFVASCAKLESVLEKAESIPSKMDNLNVGMSKTNEKIRMQTLAVAEKELLDEKNQQFLAPIPADMMAPGKIFAETLTAHEALEWIYKSLKKVNLDVYAGEENEVLKNNFNRKKMGYLMAVTVVCGFLPDETVNSIITDYIQKSDRFKTTGLNILALRYKFYNDVMLSGSLFSESFSTLGHLEKAIEYNNKIETIVRLPYVDQIKIQFLGFTAPEINEGLSFQVDVTTALNNWNRMKAFAENDFVAVGMSGNAQADAAEIQRQTAVFTQNMNLVDNKIKSWTPGQP